MKKKKEQQPRRRRRRGPEEVHLLSSLSLYLSYNLSLSN
ncbi:putative histone H3.v1 [Iris pallida]|uniref:Histone H3.v1 n=1 Tax=Iris pallida TaxID=29817 RepID=A0AAX6DQ08_IRIPA|nr:putative histone H3.v1 [Iris pallida]